MTACLFVCIINTKHNHAIEINKISTAIGFLKIIFMLLMLGVALIFFFLQETNFLISYIILHICITAFVTFLLDRIRHSVCHICDCIIRVQANQWCLFNFKGSKGRKWKTRDSRATGIFVFFYGIWNNEPHSWMVLGDYLQMETSGEKCRPSAHSKHMRKKMPDGGGDNDLL